MGGGIVQAQAERMLGTPCRLSILHVYVARPAITMPGRHPPLSRAMPPTPAPQRQASSTAAMVNHPPDAPPPCPRQP